MRNRTQGGALRAYPGLSYLQPFRLLIRTANGSVCNGCQADCSSSSFSCRPSCHLSYRPFSMTSYYLSCPGLNRSFCRRPILYSLWPRRGSQLPSSIRLPFCSLLQCVQPYVSACRCNYLCLL